MGHLLTDCIQPLCKRLNLDDGRNLTNDYSSSMNHSVPRKLTALHLEIKNLSN
jgi:hypothetical protein